MLEIMPLSDWAGDRQHYEIAIQDLAAHCDGLCMECGHKIINQHLWQYLNLNLTGHAKLTP